MRRREPHRTQHLKSRSLTALSASVCLLLLPSAPTLAQERSLALEEVIVTASRREETAQNLAASVMAMSGQGLEQRGITDFADIKRMASGLYLETPTNAGSASMRVRGVGSASLSGIDPSVGILVDGVYQTRPGFAFSDMMDVEAVEVLRGPQGTLFGRNTTAGVIQIRTKDPDPTQLSGRLQTVLGNLDARELRGVLNVPLIEDVLAIRLSGHRVMRDGHTKNIFLDRDTRSVDQSGGRLKVLWNATDNFEFKWSSELRKNDSFIDEGLVMYGRDNITNGLPISGQSWHEVAAALGKTLPEVSLGRSGENRSMFEDELERHVMTLNWSLPGHHLQSITAYEETDSLRIGDRDRTPLEISTLVNDNSAESKSQEFILTSDHDSRFTYLMGLFYQEYKLHSPSILADAADLIALRGGVENPPTVSTTNANDTSKAIFGSMTYDFTDTLSATLGLRYSEETKDSYSTLLIPGRPLIEAIDEKKTFREVTHSLKVKYQANNHLMFYASLDRGFKAGGFNRQSTTCALTGGATGCLPADLLSYEPEMTDAVEIGFKGDFWDQRLRLNAAVFYQTYDDFQVAQTIHEQATTLITNAAKVESKGVEFDFIANVSDSLTVDGSITYAHSNYDKYANAPCSHAAQEGCSSGVIDLGGKKLDNAPLWTTNLGMNYRQAIEPWNGGECFTRLDVSYRSDTTLHVSLDRATDQEAYTLINGQLGFEDMQGRWRASLWAKNLTDKKYAISSVSNSGGLSFIQGLPRTYGITLDWFF